MALPVGKVPPEVLAQALAGRTRPAGEAVARVVVGPALGVDAAAIDLGGGAGGEVLVTATDPITFAAERPGWYAVHVNANDVAVMGARPLWFQVAMLLPPGRTEAADVERLLAEVAGACAAIGVDLVGGHSEVTAGIDRPILVGQMMGLVPRGRLVTAAGGRPGDAIVLTRRAAIEGTAILAREFGERAAARGVDPAAIERARGFLDDPGISVVAAARILTDAAGAALHAMHDPTEGGIATGVRELAAASGCGAALEAGSIPIYPETEAICRALDLDPLGLIASGSLVAALEPSVAGAAVQALAREGIEATRIGTLVRDPVFTLGVEPLPEFLVDELTKVE